MNIFELSFFLTLAIGVVSGGIALKQHGVLAIFLGSLTGFGIGLICYFAILGISTLLAKTIRFESPPKKLILFVPWWVTNFASTMIMLTPPVLIILLVQTLKMLLIK